MCSLKTKVAYSVRSTTADLAEGTELLVTMLLTIVEMVSERWFLSPEDNKQRQKMIKKNKNARVIAAPILQLKQRKFGVTHVTYRICCRPENQVWYPNSGPRPFNITPQPCLLLH